MKKLFIFFVLFMAFSCSMQKRHYMKGFYFASKHNKERMAEKPVVKNNKEISDNIIIVNSPEPDLEASVNSHANLTPGMTVRHLSHITVHQSPNKDSCDEIILVNGNIIAAKVFKIGVNEIEYKPCDNLSGPTISTLKSEVFMVRYPNGTKTVIEQKSVPSKSDETTLQETNNNSIVALCCGIVSLIGFFLLSIPAAIIGIIHGKRAKREIYGSPKKFTPGSLGMAKAGIICSVIGLIIWGIVVIILL